MRGRSKVRRYLYVALWPAGLAAIAAATVLAARRLPGTATAGGRKAGRRAGHGPARLAAAAESPDGSAGARLAAAAEGLDGSASARPAAVRPGWPGDLAKLGAVSCAGGLVAYQAMALLGPAVTARGPAIDEPFFRWTISHQVDWWAAVLVRLNKVGNTWTTWGAAGTAAACLGVAWRKRRWLPAAVLGAAVLVDHWVTIALRHKIGRPGPPTSPLGTYPAGGTDRVILFYGLIAHLLWREFSGTSRGKAWAIGAVAALSFNQAYCRQYLSKHWFTDIVSGLFYGCLLLAVFLVAVRGIAGPSDAATAAGRAAAPPRPASDAGGAAA
jgi:hypothetical protein